MLNKKKIPCRVCGKLFEPCSYCQSHADVFRWRNFACSRECAAKYINETIKYRESMQRTPKTTDIADDKELNQQTRCKKMKHSNKNIHEKQETLMDISDKDTTQEPEN